MLARFQLVVKEFMGGHRNGTRNYDGNRVLDFAVANDFVTGNTFFAKRKSHLSIRPFSYLN